MAKRRSPIFQKVSNLIKVSIFIAKMRLVYLKKTTKLGKFKFLNHYNSYGYIQEHQFSPSRTPLIHFRRKIRFEKSPFYSICFRGTSCFGHRRHGLVDDEELKWMEALTDAAIVEVEKESSELSYFCGEEESVDERAEKFIEKFYEEIKRERRQSSSSNLPLNRMLEY